MEAAMEWGLELIRAIQQVRNPALDALFIAITSLGSKDFYFLILPFLLWSIDFAIGIRVAFIFIVSAYINTYLKDLLELPRPATLHPPVEVYSAGGYGLPSGHAQLSTVIWAALADAFEKTRLWILAILLTILIGFSRVYLGVHFPTDVLAGWLIGALLVFGYIALRQPVEAWLEKQALPLHLALAIVLSAVLVLLHATEDTVGLAGMLMGAGIGVALLSRWFEYHASGRIWKRAVRFVIGLAVLGALRFGLKMAFPEGAGSLGVAFRFLRYAILGLWIGLGAPWLFNRLQLTATGEERQIVKERRFS